MRFLGSMWSSIARMRLRTGTWSISNGVQVSVLPLRLSFTSALAAHDGFLPTAH